MIKAWARSFSLMAPIFALIASSASAVAAEDFRAPELTGPIVDEVGVIARDQYEALDRELRALSDSGRAQIAVLVANSLQGLAIEDYGIRLAEAWRIGTKSKDRMDRGAIFIVAPSERRMRIEVGYGLEGEIPDAVASQILERVVKPYFREDRMSEGIVAGTRALIQMARGEGTDSAGRGAGAGTRSPIPGAHSPIGIGVLFFVLILIAVGAFARLPFALAAGLIGGLELFGSVAIGLGAGFVLYLISRLLFGHRRVQRSGFAGFFGGFSGGGGSFGGGGGSFGGGGGSFGGGGASSRW